MMRVLFTKVVPNYRCFLLVQIFVVQSAEKFVLILSLLPYGTSCGKVLWGSLF